MSKEYTDKQINSMILFLRVNNIAEMYYLDKTNSFSSPVDYGKNYLPTTDDSQDKGDYIFFDYKSGSHLSRDMVSSTAISEGWKENWTTTGEQ
tara:strand:+ start:837 stop:1115 length:279 start_codon:yes stop_codon:yes gene_type:complete